MDDDDRPHRSPLAGAAGSGSGATGDAANRLQGEDLGPYSADELAQRIALLEAEIARVARHRDAAAAHRSAADALFGRKG